MRERSPKLPDLPQGSSTAAKRAKCEEADTNKNQHVLIMTHPTIAKEMQQGKKVDLW
jgi:hypothetical protein